MRTAQCSCAKMCQDAHRKVVQERLGHANVGITLDIYSHVSANMQSNTAERIDEGMGAAVAKWRA